MEKRTKKRRFCRGASSHWASPRRFCVSGENASLPADKKKKRRKVFTIFSRQCTLPEQPHARRCTRLKIHSFFSLPCLNNCFPSSVNTLIFISFQKPRGENRVVSLGGVAGCVVSVASIVHKTRGKRKARRFWC